MRRDFFETLRLFCVLGALLIIGLVIFSALFAGCKPVNELQSSEVGKTGMTCFYACTIDGHDYILAKDRDYCSIALTHNAGCKKCAEERKRSVYEDMLCASTGNKGYVEVWTNIASECKGVAWTNIVSLCEMDGKLIPRALRENFATETIKRKLEAVRNNSDTEALKRELEAARNDIYIEPFIPAEIAKKIRESEKVKKLYGLQERDAE